MGEERVQPRRPEGTSRRKFLAAAAAGAAGVASLGIVLGRSDADDVPPTGPSTSWLFGRYTAGCVDADFDEGGLTAVTVPHCVAPLSFQGWDPVSWESLWIYRQHFDADADLRRARAFVRFEGVLSSARVYLNGRPIGEHEGGYLPFECELTGSLTKTGNVLAVAVDGRWDQNTPPDLPRFALPSAIDFYQPGGIYRPVTVEARPRGYLADVFAQQSAVLTPDRRIDLNCVIDSDRDVVDEIEVSATLRQGGPVLTSAAVDLEHLSTGRTDVQLTLTGLTAARLWDLDDPALCEIDVTLRVDGDVVHTKRIRTGLREAAFTPGGFSLNGRPVKLFGLNRHQWFPYVGGAMPDRLQRQDAELLKREFNCNMVRCSHYPQSPAFLDACDELGLMVWEEIPGWDFVGDKAWQRRALQDVHDMVVRDRNHPSIIVWGSRINETRYNLPLYDQTDALAEQLDPTRPTTGALAGRSGYYSALDPAQDGDAVFSYNDYSRPRDRAQLAVLRPPRTGVPYLVSESVGTIVGAHTYRRTDPVAVQELQAPLHATVHDLAAADPHYCGLLAWAAYDYPSGWYHSVDGMKSPGVADFFRLPKLGAAMYRAQADPARTPVVEPGFYWDFGPQSPVTGPGRGALVWSNCDSLALYLDDRPIGRARRQRARFPHLPQPPFAVDLVVPAGRKPTLRIDGYLGGRLVVTRRFSGDPTRDTLHVAPDDPVILADGTDTTRVVVRAVDLHGAPRPFVAGTVSFALTGPATFIGDNPLDLEAAGAAAAVYLRGLAGQPGPVTLQAAHPTLGTTTTTLTTTTPQP